MNRRPPNPPLLHIGILTAIGILCLPLTSPAANTPLPGWKHTGVMAVLTTPDGANLAAGAVVEGFPLLVRLHRDWFDFSQARPDGADLRFTSDKGAPLPHQIEEWDPAAGSASIWVRMPRIEGNARLPLRMHWGKTDANNASDGKAVFNDYLSVWHMNDPVRDENGMLESKDNGTTATVGMIGPARHFPGGVDISCGDKITTYPTGDAPHTTELWFRAEQANVNLIGWGNEKAQGKAVMQFQGPPHIRMDCYFSEGSIKSEGLMAPNQWNHVAFTYENGDARIYLNGALAGKSKDKGPPMNLTNPAKLWLGSWHGGNAFIGDLDEVRVSKVMRPAEWLRLQYENQKPLQTVVGPLVRPGGDFAVTPEKAIVPEGGRARFNARAGGAIKLYWSLVRDGNEEILAVDRFAFDLTPGRVAGDAKAVLRLKAVFSNDVKTRDIPITLKEAIPDPEFTMEAPPAWDGRSPIEIKPKITNMDALRTAGAGDVRLAWQAGPAAVTKDTLPDGIRLLAAQKDGPLTLTAMLDNGGTLVSRSATINVTQPAKHIWVERVPERDEKPEEGQFYARDDHNEGTLHYNGTLAKPAGEVFLRVFADDKPYTRVTAKTGTDLGYVLSAKLKPGFIKYRIEFGTRNGTTETVLDKIGNLVCGDAFLIEGQSNAECLDLREEHPKKRETHEWLRTYGGPMGPENGPEWLRQHWQKTADGTPRPNLWSLAVWARQEPEHKTWIGWWGMELGKRLVASQRVPVFILNGAFGGTRIDQHQRNSAIPADPATIYGRFLWRLQQARLTHGIRAIIWHQGESDQPGANPMGKPGHEIYQPLFLEMAAGWQRDFPNARHYYMFQIWPNACAMGGSDGAGDRLRESQRTLPDRFSNLSILSTLGIRPPGGCHYPREGYDEFARMLQPLIERDRYGRKPDLPVTPPNLRRAGYASAARDAIKLEFDQPVVWLDAFADQFYLDGQPGKVASGSVAGSVLTLKLKEPTAAKHITYLKETNWNQDNLIIGMNGLAALTFCEVPVSPQPANE